MTQRKRFQKGKMVNGEFQGPGSVDRSLGSGTRDDVPALLTAGEYVIRKETVDLVGENYLNKLNSTGVGSGFQKGELSPPSRFNRGGAVRKGYQRGNLVKSNNNRRNTVPQTRGLGRGKLARGRSRRSRMTNQPGPGVGRTAFGTMVGGRSTFQRGRRVTSRRGSTITGGPGSRTASGKARYAAGGPSRGRRLSRTRNVEFENFQQGGRATARTPAGPGKLGLRGRGYQSFQRGGAVQQKASFAQESMMVNNRSLVETRGWVEDMKQRRVTIKR